MQFSVVTPLRVAVLDDHSLIRLALNSRLSRETDLAVVGVYSGSAELISALRVLTIDLLVLDYQLQDGELDGLNLIRLLRKQYPQLLILISSSAEKPAIVKLAIGAGANGFFGKSLAAVVNARTPYKCLLAAYGKAKLAAYGIQNLQSLCHDLGPDAVAGQDSNMMVMFTHVAESLVILPSKVKKTPLP